MEGADWRAGDKKRTGAFKGTWWINPADSETPPEVCHRPFCLERPDAEDLDLRQHGASWLVFNAFVRCRALQRLHLCTQHHTNPPITPIFLFGSRLSASSSRPRPSWARPLGLNPFYWLSGTRLRGVCVWVGGCWCEHIAHTHTRPCTHYITASLAGGFASSSAALQSSSSWFSHRRRLGSAIRLWIRFHDDGKEAGKKNQTLHPTLCGCNDGPGRPRYEWLHAGKRSPSNRQTGSLWKDHGLKAGAPLCSGQTLRKRPCEKELRQLLQSR